ncbi:hypothetical protein BN1110_02379 [bacterium YEK0313]|nr:hypothetical protein BN1110_02379 [bacterium YEK0313]
MARILVHHDPVRRISTYHEDMGDGTILQTREQDVEAVLAEAKLLREANEGRPWGNGQVVAAIPDTLFQKHFQAPLMQRDRAKIRHLLNGEFSAFRTRDKI